MAQIQHALCLAFPVWHPLNNPPCEIPSFTSSFINSNIVIETKLKVHFSFLFLFLFFSGMIGKYFSSPRIICLRSPCCVRGASGKRSRGQLRVLWLRFVNTIYGADNAILFTHFFAYPFSFYGAFFLPPPHEVRLVALGLGGGGRHRGQQFGYSFPALKSKP